MKVLTAISNNPDPKKRVSVTTHLHPSVFKMTDEEKKKFGNINNKLYCIAQDNLGDKTKLHHYELS